MADKGSEGERRSGPDAAAGPSRPGPLGRLATDHQLRNAIAGAVAGAATAALVCPLDVLKTRAQVMGRGERGIAGSLADLWRREGRSGLFRGLSPTILALLPKWAVYFTTYDRIRRAAGPWAARGGARRERVADVAAAGGAGAATLVATNPLWVAKTRLQTQSVTDGKWSHMAGGAYRSPTSALVRIAREEGLRGLYSGLGPSLVGVTHAAIQFPLYEETKRRVGRAIGTHPDALPLPWIAVASAVSKAVASAATHPHEVIRSRMHVAGSGPFRGMKRIVTQVYRNGGIGAFYAGCLTNLARTVPAAVLTVTTYEAVARGLAALGEGGVGGRRGVGVDDMRG